MHKPGDTSHSNQDDNDWRPAYRNSLIQAEQAMQGEFDRSVLTLSGGALGISLMFLKDIVAGRALIQGELLLCSWAAWGFSIAFVLVSYFTSAKSLREALRHTDSQIVAFTMARSAWSSATAILNALSGIAFIVGVITLIWFASLNLK